MPAEPLQEPTVILHDEGLRRLEGFTQIPNVVLTHPTISPTAKITYGVLLSYAWQKDFCWPAQERLAQDMNCSVRAVQRYLTELEEGGLIHTKRRGLNRPNVYEILPIASWLTHREPAQKKDTTDLSSPEATEMAAPDATPPSLLEATGMSYKEDSTEKIQVVNALTANDPNPIGRRDATPTTDQPPVISDRTLRKTYGLTDDQISRVHYLVDRQVEQLGSAAQNHGHYVKRAAEAVRDGEDNFLDQLLSEFRQALVAKQNAKSRPVGSRPAFFHRMYTEALEKRRPTNPSQPGAANRPASRPSSNRHPQPADVIRSFTTPDDGPADEARERLIADAERRGVPIPDYIRTADIRAVNRWWAALVTEPEK